MTLEDAQTLAETLMRSWGITDYTFKWMNGKRTFGRCNYTRRQILLSKHYVYNYHKDLIRDTILHEIAHALAGPRAGHGPEWKRQCRKVGARPVRCKDVELVGHKWEIHCKLCPQVYKYFRRPAAKTLITHRCGKCKGGLTLKPAMIQ